MLGFPFLLRPLDTINSLYLRLVSECLSLVSAPYYHQVVECSV